jgi:hypothetical protein
MVAWHGASHHHYLECWWHGAGPTPPYRSFDGMSVHATIACFAVRHFGFLPVTFQFLGAGNEKVMLKLNNKFDSNYNFI